MTFDEHILTCLSEESIEVSKDIHKALRFGLDDRNVLNPDGPTNRERIVQELNDLMAVIEMAVDEGLIPHGWEDRILKNEKREKVTKFVGYAREQGAIEDP